MRLDTVLVLYGLDEQFAKRILKETVLTITKEPGLDMCPIFDLLRARVTGS